MARNQNPGLHFEERTGLPVTLVPAALDLYGLVGHTKRGPTNKAREVTSWAEFERIYGGLFGSNYLPLSVRAFFAMRGQRLLIARVAGTSARHGTAVILDSDGYATMLVSSRNVGAEYKNVSISTKKHETTITVPIAKKYTAGFGTGITFTSNTIVHAGSPDFVADGWAAGQKVTVKNSTNNNGTYTITAVSSTALTVAETLTVNSTPDEDVTLECTGVTVADASGFEIGDVFRCSDGTDTAVSEIFNVDAANSRIEFYPLSPVPAGPVASGSTINTAHKHLVSTKTAANIGSSDTNVTLVDGSGVRVGMVLLFHRNAVIDGAPKSAVVTAVNGNVVTIASSLGVAITAGSKVTSCEFGLQVRDNGVLVEEYPFLSMSSTFADRYVQDTLGTGVTRALGTDTTRTTMATLDSGDTSILVSTASGLVAGDHYLIDTSAAQDGSSGVYIHAKTVDYSTNTITFDDIGNIGTSVASGKKIWNVTYSVTEADSNKSEYVVVDEVTTKGESDSQNGNGEHRKLPRAYTNVALTGGVDDAPSGKAEYIGSSTPGSKTGIYLFEDAPSFKELAAFAIPGAEDTEVSRAALDSDAKDWAEANGVLYISSVPSPVTKNLDAKLYRTTKLSFSSSFMALYYPWVKIYDPSRPGQIIKIPADGYQMGLMASRSARLGIHYPPANEAYRGVVDLAAVVSDVEHGLLNEAGVNVIRRRGIRGFVPMGTRTLHADIGDNTGRHNINVRMWLNFVRRTLESGMDSVLFLPANKGVFAMISDPVRQFLAGQFAAGAMAPSSASDAFFVKADDETTRQTDLTTGDVYCHIGVVPAGAVERVHFVVFGFAGSVRVREV